MINGSAFQDVLRESEEKTSNMFSNEVSEDAYNNISDKVAGNYVINEVVVNVTLRCSPVSSQVNVHVCSR